MKNILKLLGYAKSYIKESLLAPFFIMLEVITECLIPFITAKLVNRIQTGVNMPEVLQYGFSLIGLALLSLLFGTLAGIFAATASGGYAKNIRKALFSSVQQFSFSNIDKFSTSSLVTRLTSDINNVENAFMVTIRMAVRMPLMLLFSLVMAFSLGGKMAFIYVGLVPALLFIIFFVASRVIPLFKKAFRKYDDLNESVQENIEGIRVVKTFVREEFEKKKLRHAADELSDRFLKINKIMALGNPLMQIFINISMAFVSLASSYLILSSGAEIMNLGNYSGLLTYGVQILFSCVNFSVAVITILLATEPARRIMEVLQEKPDIETPKNPVTTVKDGSIAFENVSFRYSKTAESDALSSVSFSVKSGETVGIIGGTGSSKTTLVQMIPRLYDATGGTVKVGGVDVKQYDLEALRSEVSMVLQKNVLFSGTIKENLRWGNPEATDAELVHACELAAADDFVRAFPDGYDTVIDRGGTNVSGGQKQRLCIARALLKKPKILILDDSTSAVDTATDYKIRKAFREELPDTTKLIIAQRISSVETADRIFVLDDGKLCGVGTHDELMETNAIYKEVYESQMKGGIGE